MNRFWTHIDLLAYKCTYIRYMWKQGVALPHPYSVPKVAFAGLAIRTEEEITYWRGQFLWLKVIHLNLNFAISYLSGLLEETSLLSFLCLLFLHLTVFMECLLWTLSGSRRRVRRVGKGREHWEQGLKGKAAQAEEIIIIRKARKSRACEKHNHLISISSQTASGSGAYIQVQEESKKSVKRIQLRWINSKRNPQGT